MAKKLCFLLGAGGARGIAHVGFLKAMEEEGIKPNCIGGCSMGAVVGACYSKGVSIDKMKSVIDTIKMKDIVDVNLMPFNKKSLFRSLKMRQRIIDLLGDGNIEDLDIPFECVAVDIVKGKVVTLNKGCLINAVCASSAIPMVFKPVEIDDMELIDGGVLMRIPYASATHFKADVTIAVDVIGGLKEFKPTRNIFSQAMRVLEVADTFIAHKNHHYHKPDLLITPDMGDMSQFKAQNLDVAYEAGYKAGKENAQKIKDLLKE